MLVSSPIFTGSQLKLLKQNRSDRRIEFLGNGSKVGKILSKTTESSSEAKRVQ